ncbi:MAG TPA: transglycosylase domain-containing protein, partial [Bryobacteraceae bacterium]|nr:transglycosylase domain-containing protein [Bryobacteraceae bacterium]
MRTIVASKQTPRWRRLMRVWRRGILRRRVAILTALVVPLLVISIPAGLFYRHYAAEIDQRLLDGPFHDSVNIYASPFILSAGDGLTATDVESELHLASFEASDRGAPRTFRAAGNTIDVFPSQGDSARITAGPKGIARIEVNGHAVRSWTIGYPLMANLSSDREKRRLISFDKIPPVLVKAVVSAEDKHFFQHNGLDLPRVIKAAYVDFRDGRKEQGASTLTMQLVRGLWLHPEKRWKRKLAEAMMTIHLERKWSKEKIFETYANQVYLGRDTAYSIHGFAEGSEYFFGKPLRDISLPEAALLAGMVQRPSYFNPYRNPNRARDRRDLVLALMRDNGYIGRSDYTQAVGAPIALRAPGQRRDTYAASWFLDLVSDELQKDRGDEQSSDVYSTIDLNLQRAAHEAIDTGMQQVDKLLARKYKTSGSRAEAALIALDPQTGEIKALVGGRNYAQSQLNRILAKRPPGSVFKPFVYAAAVNTAVGGGENVFTPASTVDDEPTTFWFGGKSYEPANFRNETFGTLTLRDALAKSDNVAAVKVAESVGFGSVVAMARRAGLNDEIRATPSVALGSYAVTPLEMAGAYTAFANGGLWVRPKFLHNEQPEVRQAMDPRVAYVMVNMLEEVLRSGTGAGVRARGFTLPAAGKTGTSHVGWFAGFTSRLLCVVWVGFDDYRELDLEGAKSALPIWTEFMKRAALLSPYRYAKEFFAPGGIDTARICSDTGKLAGDYCVDTRNEVFIAGTEPQEKCDLHQFQNVAGPVGEGATTAPTVLTT